MAKNVKKNIVISLLAVFALTFGLMTGCSGNTEPEPAEQAQESSIMSDYSVSVNSCTLTNDYDGNDIAVIEYTWTNNSETVQSFWTAIGDTVFQNGIALDPIWFDCEGFDLNTKGTDIQPNTTYTVYGAYILDDMSDIDVYVTDYMIGVEITNKTFSLV